MPKFKIYAGLSGGFGGAVYQGIYEYDTIEEAENDAYTLAVEEYESYAGSQGLMSWAEAKEDLIESFGIEPSEEDVNDHYQEYVESWISYYVEEVYSNS